jgi:hypothetical protein
MQVGVTLEPIKEKQNPHNVLGNRHAITPKAI